MCFPPTLRMKGCITFMNCYSTVVTLDYFISIFTVISKTNATNQNMVHFLGTPILRLLKDQRVLVLKNEDTWIMLGTSILFKINKRSVICSILNNKHRKKIRKIIFTRIKASLLSKHLNTSFTNTIAGRKDGYNLISINLEIS